MNEVDQNLGKLGRDKVTGFEGIITVKGVHLFGSNSQFGRLPLNISTWHEIC